MACPQCRSDEISASGICLVCGYSIVDRAIASQPESADQESKIFSRAAGSSPAGDTNEVAPKEELPRWRQDLSQRLSALKQNRQTPGSTERRQIEDEGMSVLISQMPAAEQSDVLPSQSVDKTQGTSARQIPQQRSEKTLPSVRRQKTLAPLGPEAFAVNQARAPTDRQEVKNLIDSAVSRQSVRKGKEAAVSAPGPHVDNEGKLILLSRTLSGLIDLIFILLCTGVFIISADYFSGIVALDFASLAGYSALLLLTYFLYSIFFLAASNQTIGMMITDLRVVGTDGKRPSIAQLFSRSSGYLLSLSGLGIGLLWGLFDRENMCFHDRLSRTRVIRI